VEGGVADPAARALKAKRNGDVPRETLVRASPVLRQPAIAVIEFKFPRTVEIQPVLALKLWLRELGPWNLLSGSHQSEDRQKKQGSDAHGFMVGQAFPPVHRMASSRAL